MLKHRTLNLLTLIVALLSVTAIEVGQALAQGKTDRVRLAKGSEAGEVTDTTPTEITIAKGLGGNRNVAVNEIKSIQFADEPGELSQARLNANNGAFANALTALNKINISEVKRDLIKQDIEFYKAYCAAKLALSGNGEIVDAGRQLNAFVRAYPKNFHYLAACEAMGDLLMAAEKYENAQKQYAELAKAPWADYKMRAAIAAARAFQAQGKHDDALKQFEAALAMATNSDDSQNQILSATLGKAISLAETGKVDEAISAINKVIQDADPEQKELHARAYNALGACYEKDGQQKDALLAFLRVDIVYASVPDAHAEALAHLAPLWQAVGQEERAREARQILKDKYGNSKWAKK
jgi:tetratricopeptide (TPR) repeat protein